MVPPPYGPLPLASRTKELIVVASVLVTLSTTIVSLRIYSRVATKAQVWWDDGLIIVAQTFLFVLLGLLIADFRLGVGYHVTEPHVAENLPNGLLILLFYDLVYQVTQCAVKLSVLLFYLRVFVKTWVKLATKIAIAIVVSWSLANFIGVFFMCRPFASRFDPKAYLGAECSNQVPIYTAIVCFNVVTDLPILLLPIPTIWTLNMKRRQRVFLGLAFLISSLVFAATIVRIMFMLKLDNHDLTYSGLNVWFWSIVEPSLAIFTISLPMIIPLYFQLRGRKPNHSAPVMRDVEGGGQIVTIGGSGGKGKGNHDHDPYRLPTTRISLEDNDTASTDEVTNIPSTQGLETPLALERSHAGFLPPIPTTDCLANGNMSEKFSVKTLLL
ncbi:hypothetical protein HD806DRAFT_532612 [Xylariaceae sp. AK1471]|nr:hypothetical protein HD806DRAFT_532612 [Xylariaceae sp. AK1471]